MPYVSDCQTMQLGECCKIISGKLQVQSMVILKAHDGYALLSILS